MFVQGHTVHGIWGLGEALKTLKLGPDSRLSVKQLAFAMEKVRFDTSMGEIAMRAEDHQALLPPVVSVVSKDAKYKVDGTDMGSSRCASSLARKRQDRCSRPATWSVRQPPDQMRVVTG